MRAWRVVKKISEGPWHHNSYHPTRGEARTRAGTIKAQGMQARAIKRTEPIPTK